MTKKSAMEKFSACTPQLHALEDELIIDKRPSKGSATNPA